MVKLLATGASTNNGACPPSESCALTANSHAANAQLLRAALGQP